MKTIHQKEQAKNKNIFQPHCSNLAVRTQLSFPSAGKVEIPFGKCVNHIVVRVRDGAGTGYTFFVDTGASMSVVTPEFFQSRDSKVIAGLEGASVHGARGAITGASQLIEIPFLKLGELAIRNLAAVVVDLSSITERAGEEIHGIIGYNLLSRVTVLIDYQSGTLTIAQPDMKFEFATPGYPGHTIPFELLMGSMIAVKGYVNETIELPFILDTGSRFTFLNRPAVQSSGIAFRPLEDQPAPLGLGSEEGVNVAAGRAMSLRIGDLMFQGPELYAIDLPVFATMGLADRPAGVLGNDLLQDFQVAIDYQRQNLIFRPV